MSRAHPIARPKRFAEQLEGSSTVGISAAIPQSKKARTQFSLQNPSTLAADDDNDEDAILELDEIGRKGNQTKRNAVELDGYESDSSQENFEARADAKAKAGDGKGKGKKTKEEEANDMFADLEDDMADGDDDEDLATEGKKRKKNVRFMEANEIEGQVANSKSGGHVSADFSLGHKEVDKDHESSSDEGDDEVRDMMDEDLDEELGAGAKKKHAPKLDAFNMRNEQEEGRFDENGNFVRKAADAFALHDAWLEGTSKAEIKKAKDAEEKRAEDRRRREREDDAISTGTLLGQLITRLQNGETSLEALARLASKPKEKKKPKWQKNKKSSASEMDIDQESAKDDPVETERKVAVEAITAAADGLLTRGQPEIYDHERAVLMRQYKRETGDEWIDAVTSARDNDSAPQQWEYRWADERDGGEHHGPYDGPTMTSWNEAGYFGEGVVFRQVGTSDWSDSVDFH
jgi:CD2 antigen cytoplasmic tail-binding protein 2